MIRNYLYFSLKIKQKKNQNKQIIESNLSRTKNDLFYGKTCVGKIIGNNYENFMIQYKNTKNIIKYTKLLQSSIVNNEINT